MDESARLARRAGREVVVAARASDVKPRPGDCVHLFNIQRCLDWGDLPERTRSAGARLLLTPLLHPTGDYHLRGRRGLDALAARIVPSADAYAGLRWGRKSLAARARAVLGLADSVLLSHEREERLLLDTFGLVLEPGKRQVIPVAIPDRSELDSGARDTEPSGDFVLCAGRLEPLKNSEAVARACAALQLPVGFAGSRPGMRHLGYGRGILKEGNWLGELSYSELRSTMARARVHVLASWAEVVGRVSLEAALAGAAVVLSDVGFGPDYLGRGTEGVFLFAPGDENGLKDAIAAAWERGRRPESALVERVRTRYTWEVVGPALVEAWSA
ncbi:MAG: glycosyltransferase [Myxococcota bacterium]|nr:glycosyltransferase [Myxococcota bacterium]